MDREEDKIEEYFNLRNHVAKLDEAAQCYLRLFSKNDSNFQAIALFAGPFFGYFQTLLVEGIALRIGKLLDNDDNVISINRYITRYIPSVDRPEFWKIYSEIEAKAKGAIHMRHNWVAHSNKNTALGIVDMPEVDVMVVSEIADQMDALLMKISSKVFPLGIIGKDGSPIGFARRTNRSQFVDDMLENVKKAIAHFARDEGLI